MEFVNKNLSNILIISAIAIVSLFMLAKLFPLIIAVVICVVLYTSVKKLIKKWTRSDTIDSDNYTESEVMKNKTAPKYSTKQAIDVDYTEVKR